MSLLLVHNPRAGGGRAARLLPRIRAALSARGLATELLPGATAEAQAEALAGLSFEGVTGIAAIGGDGTLFGIVNALYRNPRTHRPPLGVIPVGTGNAFARDLGIAPGDWNGAIDVLAAGLTRRVDVARIETGEETFHFVNIAGAGFIVDAGRAALRFKSLGQGAYTLGTLLALARLRSHRLRVEIDGEVLQHDSIFVEVSNTRYTGTHFLIAPGAVPDDGLLDVTICRALPRWRLILLFPTVFTGRHVHYPEISVLRGRHIRLEAPAGLPLMVDGEFRGRLPAEIRCLPRDLEVFSAPCS